MGRKIMLDYFAGKIEYMSNLAVVVAHGVRSCLTLKATPWHALKETTREIKIMKAKMNSKLASTMVLGALKEFVTNERYYSYSKVGMEYSYLTDTGKEELARILEVNLSLLRDSLEYDAEQHAKRMMMESLSS